ncbi:hypothetical protein CDAR_571351 [Caerostris darwini]|uniref:Uncharacterized protein n=1 Tax=Caerostris darwini TaxID=1538125 RepID=A0AAV4SNA5_9ARAC|nr:hypothetical protein CDAR_571351 [Caerostris darwini]
MILTASLSFFSSSTLSFDSTQERARGGRDNGKRKRGDTGWKEKRKENLRSLSELAPLSLANKTPRSILFSRRLHSPERPYRSYRADAVHSLLPYPVAMETTNAVHPSGRLRADVVSSSSSGSDKFGAKDLQLGM